MFFLKKKLVKKQSKQTESLWNKEVEAAGEAE